MKIELTEDKKKDLMYQLGSFMEGELDIEISDFKLEELINFCTKIFGHSIYNSAIKDACAYMSNKIGDMEMDLYAEERKK